MQLSGHPYKLYFKQAAGTSRGVLTEKQGYYLKIKTATGYGFGEVSWIQGLSSDHLPSLHNYLAKNKDISRIPSISKTPSLHFGIEMAKLDCKEEEEGILFHSNFTRGLDGININGLVWMGSKAFMNEQISTLLQKGYGCIKMKICAIDLEEELAILTNIRKEYTKSDIELRVDANGGLSIEQALEVLPKLRELDIHSIEQPLQPKYLDQMSELCERNDLDIALDEQLISVFGRNNKTELLKKIKPQYIVLKPSLLGGFTECDEWIDIAEENNISWWVTSALESNIGLSAIAQWLFHRGYNTTLYQGLGTGQLFKTNIPSPLEIKSAQLFYNPVKKWDYSSIQ